MGSSFLYNFCWQFPRTDLAVDAMVHYYQDIWRMLSYEEFSFVLISGSINHIYMMTSSNGHIFRVTCHMCGESTGPRQRPVARSLDVFFDLRLNKRLSKQTRGWWFETLSRPLWRHCNNIHNSCMHQLSRNDKRCEYVFKFPTLD